MQENQVERKINTNSKGSSFTSIARVLELIDRTLVYGVVLLQAGNEDRVEFSRENEKEHRKKRDKRKKRTKWERWRQDDVKKGKEMRIKNKSESPNKRF